MASDPSKCDSPIEPADPAPQQPCDVTDDFYNIGIGLATGALVLGVLASMNLLGDLVFRITNLGYGIIRSAVAAILGLTLGIIANKDKFKPQNYPTWPKVSIIVNVVGLVFAIIMGFFYLL